MGRSDGRWAVSRRGLFVATLFLVSPFARAQLLSNLEPERPIVVEDAVPIPFRAISAAVDWTYTARRGGLNDHGPGFSVSCGVYRGLEVGAAQRYVTEPGTNALRGVSSGDLELHALYGLATEAARRPALAVRLGVIFPTGLDSRGTDLVLGALATRSFESFRLHANLRWTRLGDTVPTERADRIEAGLAVDFVASRRGRTDTILLASAIVRSSPVLEADEVVDLELGARRRIGIQTILFAGAGSEISDRVDRPRLRLRLGLSHVF